MAIYELRTNSLYVGKLAEARELYQNEHRPALSKHEDKVVGYFIGDVGAMNQLQIFEIWSAQS